MDLAISQDQYDSVFSFWAILVYSEKTVTKALSEDFFQNLLKRNTCRIRVMIIIMLLLTNYTIKHILGIMFKRAGYKCDPHMTRITAEKWKPILKPSNIHLITGLLDIMLTNLLLTFLDFK